MRESAGWTPLSSASSPPTCRPSRLPVEVQELPVCADLKLTVADMVRLAMTMT